MNDKIQVVKEEKITRVTVLANFYDMARVRKAFPEPEWKEVWRGETIGLERNDTEKRVAFISTYCSLNDFMEHVIPQITDLHNRGYAFILAEDEIGSLLFLNKHIKDADVTVYHLHKESLVQDKFPQFKYKGGFFNEVLRDSAMTKDSTKDLNFITQGPRNEVGRVIQNIARRRSIARNTECQNS